MSTKSTIAYSDDKKYGFHLYNECFEDDTVYLEIGDQTMQIPLAVWEAIRGYSGGNLEMAAKSDAEIRTMVEEFVDDRIARVKEARKVKGKKDREGRIAWISLCGGIPFGPATDSREKQVASGIAEYTRRRSYQKKILAVAGKIKSAQRAGPYLINLKTGETKALGENE